LYVEFDALSFPKDLGSAIYIREMEVNRIEKGRTRKGKYSIPGLRYQPLSSTDRGGLKVLTCWIPSEMTVPSLFVSRKNACANNYWGKEYG